MIWKKLLVTLFKIRKEIIKKKERIKMMMILLW